MLWSREWLGEREQNWAVLSERPTVGSGRQYKCPSPFLGSLLQLFIPDSLKSESRLHLSLPRPPPSPPKVTEGIPRAEVAAVSSVIREAGAKGTGSRSLCQLAAVLLGGNP